MEDLMKDKLQKIQINGFKERTDTLFKPIAGYGASDIENATLRFIDDQLGIEYELYDEDDEDQLHYEIVGIALTGSRCRGLERKDSDIDVVVEFKANVKEYVLYNLLKEREFTIEGILVDINPIRAEETGELGIYLQGVEKYLAKKEEKHEVN